MRVYNVSQSYPSLAPPRIPRHVSLLTSFCVLSRGFQGTGRLTEVISEPMGGACAVPCDSSLPLPLPLSCCRTGVGPSSAVERPRLTAGWHRPGLATLLLPTCGTSILGILRMNRGGECSPNGSKFP